MAVTFVFLAAVFPFTFSVTLQVWRAKQDSVSWDGDCGKIDGDQVIYEKKFCDCRKRIKMNGIETILNGTLYPSNTGFLKCSYYYRETGSNIFLQPEYSTGIPVIDYMMSRGTHQISTDVKRFYGTHIDAERLISIKELQIYTFNKKKPFRKVPNTIFSLAIETKNNTKKKYSLKVNRSAAKELEGNLMQILFDSKDTQKNETTFFGFTVLKIKGTRQYDLQIPTSKVLIPVFTSSSRTKITASTPTPFSTLTQTPTSSLFFKTQDPTCLYSSLKAPAKELQYKVIAIVLAAIGVMLLIIIAILCTWKRKKQQNDQKETNNNALAMKNEPDQNSLQPAQESLHRYREIDEESYAGSKTQNAYLEPSHINNFKKVSTNPVQIKDTPNKDSIETAQESSQEYRELVEVEHDDYKTLNIYITPSDSSLPHKLAEAENIYESYEPAMIKSNLDNNDSNHNVKGIEYYNYYFCNVSSVEK